MGYKNVCLECRRTENLGTNYEKIVAKKCPKCAEKMLFVSHLFKPPKKSNDKLWKVAIFLIQNGFSFQHVYKIKENENSLSEELVSYPITISDAKVFIKTYKEQAIDILTR
ncbi:hypothetical protein ACE193_02140 [Bernardetia sp. OM2101]|uniref:hypothetical protein n=1 Tax=Bernardetia sp. OM2101 TaxID=3344876 RepID=UPI0035CEE906